MHPHIRLVRPAPDPLGLYIRAGRLDHKEVQTFITSGAGGISGVVFEAKRLQHQKELLELVLSRGLDAVLDPQTQAMATPGGYSRSIGKLPWANPTRHQTIDDFSNALSKRAMAEKIAQFAVEFKFTQVLAPTHLVGGVDDSWLDTDIETTKFLRAALNSRGGNHIQINFSLTIKYEKFRSADELNRILSKITNLPIDSLWLNIDGCGAHMTPAAVKRYGDAAVQCQFLGIPIVADHMGGIVGLSLLAFGVVGGISHGVTFAERFSTAHWKKVSDKPGFSQKLRTYISNLDLFLEKIEAEKFFESAGKARSTYGCRNTNCCARGVHDMINSPGRHFLYDRTQAVAGLSQIPSTLRPMIFMEQHLRRASDEALIAPQLPLSDSLRIKLEKQSKRLNDLRVALGKYADERRSENFAQHPSTRRAREARS